MARKLLALSILVLVILMIATPAAATGNHKVTICHAAGLDGTTKYVTLTISERAVYKDQGGHFYENGTPRAGHENDYFGECEEPSTTTTSTTSSTTTTQATTTTTQPPSTTTTSNPTTTTLPPTTTSTTVTTVPPSSTSTTIPPTTTTSTPPSTPSTLPTSTTVPATLPTTGMNETEILTGAIVALLLFIVGSALVIDSRRR